MAGTIDKIKAKVDNVLHKDSTHNDPTGPHSTHAANKADPRVDSDRIGNQGNTAGAGGIGGGQYTEGTTGHHTGHHTGTGGGLTGSSGYSDPSGPHDSRLANKADPRVDSDRVGPAGNTASAGGYGHGTGLTGTSGSDPTGPHDSRLANKLDPRVDSDRMGTQGNTSGAGGLGGGQYTEGTTGHHAGHHGHGTTGGGLTGSSGYSDPTGPHDSRLANKADPRVDSDRYGVQGNTAGAGGVGGGQYTEGTHGHGVGHGLSGTTPGSGTANKTAGPHNSDLLNKVDPRVDSDMDGSKTYGGNQTYN